jgi:hypothetical protein
VLSTRGLEARGDVRAGSATSRLAFFGAEPEHRTAPWSVGNLPDQRGLDASADLTQVRAALATLLRDLQSYGLLDS